MQTLVLTAKNNAGAATYKDIQRHTKTYNEEKNENICYR